MSKTPPPKHTTPSTAPETITILEQHQLLDKLKNEAGTERQIRLGIRNWTMALLMLDTGLRVGEVVKLHQADLILAGEPMLNLRIRVEISKTKTERTVPLSERVRDAVKAMQKQWWNDPANQTYHYAFHRYAYNRPLTTRQVERIIEKAALAAFGREINPHRLRHTFGSKMMRIAPARVVQECLGHTNLSSTQIYQHPNEDDKKKAIDALVGEELREIQQEN